MTATASSTVVRNLTLPISPWFPVGAIMPWDSPHQREDIVTVERNRAHLFHIRTGSGTGTRLRSSGFGIEGGGNTDGLELSGLVDRDAVILRIPKEAGQAIERDAVTRAVQSSGWSASDLKGAAVILATGWGDNERYRKLGEAYVIDSPYLHADAAEELADQLDRIGSDLLLTDCVDVDRAGGTHARDEWVNQVPWQRPPWPSDQAKAYLRYYTRDKAVADRAATLTLSRSVSVVVGLAGCGDLHGDRTSLTVLPMPVADVAEVPCTVVAHSIDSSRKAKEKR